MSDHHPEHEEYDQTTPDEAQDPGSSETPTAPPPDDGDGEQEPGEPADATANPASGPGPRGNPEIDPQRVGMNLEDLDRMEIG